MRHLPAVFILSVSAVYVACVGGGTMTSSSAPTRSLSPGDPTIGFSGLSGLLCSGPPTSSTNPSCAVSTYTESGFTVSVMSGDWSVRSDYGHPAPFIEFYVPCVQQASTCVTPATPGTGTIKVTAGGATFSFKSVDLYASLVPIPYQITGLRNSTTFTMAATLPNSFGDFATVVNPQAADVIDTLVISLTDAVSAMGLDNIAVTH